MVYINVKRCGHPGYPLLCSALRRSSFLAAMREKFEPEQAQPRPIYTYTTHLTSVAHPHPRYSSSSIPPSRSPCGFRFVPRVCVIALLVKEWMYAKAKASRRVRVKPDLEAMWNWGACRSGSRCLSWCVVPRARVRACEDPRRRRWRRSGSTTMQERIEYHNAQRRSRSTTTMRHELIQFKDHVSNSRTTHGRVRVHHANSGSWAGEVDERVERTHEGGRTRYQRRKKASLRVDGG
ncbi:hypothetical protein BDN70DRAFT_439795 [Pholiota conissans]|uniref:Uncharacterized protein n=1 Tax=Pholiota conissans TaxID=109636 RepID=A0A9P5YMZ8_9AGAR|nr:hypothetical protein BDN70DRAFT_439795 [Pholiota conissans]